MSSFEVFSIDLAKLESVVGSRDAALVTAVSTDDDPPELADALHEIVGRGRRPFTGDTYSLSRATLRLCRVVGVRINANTCDLLNVTSLERVETITRPLSIGVRFGELLGGSVPLRGLPRDDEFQFGVIEAQRIPAAFAHWSRASAEDPTDDDADGILVEMGDWLEVAAARNESLIGVFWP